MNRDQIEQAVDELASDKSNENNHDFEDFKNFLAESVSGEIPLYINRRQGPFLYSFLLPNDIEMNLNHIADISEWNFDAISMGRASSIVVSSSFPGGVKKTEIYLDDNPMSEATSQELQAGKPLFFQSGARLRQP